MLNRIAKSPYAVVAIGSLVIVLMLLFVGGGIAGSYALTVHYVNSLQASQHHQAVKSYSDICRAVHQMDLAGTNASHSDNVTYGVRLSTAIHQLYLSLGCKG